MMGDATTMAIRRDVRWAVRAICDDANGRRWRLAMTTIACGVDTAAGSRRMMGDDGGGMQGDECPVRDEVDDCPSIVMGVTAAGEQWAVMNDEMSD